MSRVLEKIKYLENGSVLMNIMKINKIKFYSNEFLQILFATPCFFFFIQQHFVHLGMLLVLVGFIGIALFPN